MRKVCPINLAITTALSAALSLLATRADATVLVSDSFDRMTDNNDPLAGPIVSDWGANDNVFGGTEGSAATPSQTRAATLTSN